MDSLKKTLENGKLGYIFVCYLEYSLALSIEISSIDNLHVYDNIDSVMNWYSKNVEWLELDGLYPPASDDGCDITNILSSLNGSGSFRFCLYRKGSMEHSDYTEICIERLNINNLEEK